MGLATSQRIDDSVVRSRNRTDGLAIAAFAISLIWLLAVAYLYLLQLTDVHDDAYISFRYAANLVHGQGLVFNPGEYVEGYTNFLWTMTASLIIWLGLDPVWVTTALNVLFGIGLLALVGWFGGRMVVWGRLAPGWQYLAVFILAASSPLAFALISGLETTLFTLLLTGAVFSFVLEQRSEARWPLSGLLFALAALTRPEGVMFWALTVLYQLISMRITPAPISRVGQREDISPSPKIEGGREQGVTLRWLIGSFLLIWLPYMAWKVFYYGSIFPNTFYDKATDNRLQLVSGVQYVLGAWPYLFGPLALALALALLLWRRRISRTEAYFTLPIGVNLAYVVYVGGDYMVAYRFLLPTFPLLALLVAAASSELGSTVSGRVRLNLSAALLAAVFVAVSVLSALDPDLVAQLHTDGVYSQRSAAVIGWLQKNSQPGDTIAMETIGKIPYYSGLFTIDMLGLTDSHIAHSPGRTDYFTPGHNKTDTAYVLSRKPTYVMVYRIPIPGGYAYNLTHLLGSAGMINSKEFAADYTKAAIFPVWEGLEGWLYKRNRL